jgi:hypothetical protein
MDDSERKAGGLSDDAQDRAGEVTDRSGWLIGGLVGLAIAVAIITAIVVAVSRQDEVYPAGSPEAAFQAYLRAWDEGDTEAALAAFSERARKRVSTWEFRQAQGWADEEAARIWIDDVTERDGRVTLRLAIETVYGGLFGSERYTEHTRVTLVREDGGWKIDTPLVGYYRG